ncbi:hypothetical protein NDU88_005325 [Pleurodeles waltl]|uniref:Uncharacterized protein n=1 Tax=Pleurodeles waltl TaxID=8319 RepID=A0AAV7PJA5_PLEWA|nr:hypothetical protein NDU88_005325 [Pleurodeles waltl]
MGKSRRRDPDAREEFATDPLTAQQKNIQPGKIKNSGDPTSEDILQAITACRETLESEINAMETDMVILWDDHHRAAELITATEKNINDVKPTLSDASEKLCTLEQKIHGLEAKTDDAEHRSWCNNICVIGRPECVEGKNMVKYLEQWL